MLKFIVVKLWTKIFRGNDVKRIFEGLKVVLRKPGHNLIK